MVNILLLPITRGTKNRVTREDDSPVPSSTGHRARKRVSLPADDAVIPSGRCQGWPPHDEAFYFDAAVIS